MQVKITRTTVANKQFVHAGQVYDLPDEDARMLLQIGKAVLVDAEPAEEQPEPLTTENTDAVIATEAPKRRGRPRAK
jgi:hypothetical protein